MLDWLLGRGFRFVVAVACVLVVLAAVALLALGRGGPGGLLAGPLATEGPAPTSTAVPPLSVRMRLHVDPATDCAACHLGPDGGVGTNPIPVMAHPVEGWTNCTACHADDRLVPTAPGHSGIYRDECLACHEPPGSSSTAPAARPHHVVEGRTCVSCHGEKAPLPIGMSDRRNCWVCHQGPEAEAWFGTPAPGAPGR